ncbi:MAG TPA: hypothetical protein P5267_02750 [Patescibacteria group bacterium]|nr:hypothetical protein [Patescibacteria group bacterium]
MKKKQIFLFMLVIGMIAAGTLMVVNEQGAAVAKDVNSIINDQLDGLEKTELPGESDDPTQLIVDLIRGLLGILGLIFIILVIYAGFKWMTSGGNSSTIEDAKKMIANALLGLIIIGFSFAITQFVFSVILKGK